MENCTARMRSETLPLRPTAAWPRLLLTTSSTESDPMELSAARPPRPITCTFQTPRFMKSLYTSPPQLAASADTPMTARYLSGCGVDWRGGTRDIRTRLTWAFPIGIGLQQCAQSSSYSALAWFVPRPTGGCGVHVLDRASECGPCCLLATQFSTNTATHKESRANADSSRYFSSVALMPRALYIPQNQILQFRH